MSEHEEREVCEVGELQAPQTSHPTRGQQVEWITAAAAAEILGSKKRTVLDQAKKGKFQSRQVRDPQTRQMVVVVHAGDVERELAGVQAPEPREVSDPHASQAKQSREVRELQAPHASQTIELGVAAGLLPMLERAFRVPVRPEPKQPLFLALDQAEEYSGLPSEWLVKEIVAGRLPAINVGIRKGIRGKYRISRKDLDQVEGARAEVKGDAV